MLRRFLRSLRRPPTHETSHDPSFDDRMATVATLTVEDARTQHRQTLDFSRASVSAVEAILGTLHDQYLAGQLPEQVVLEVAVYYGAYLGQVIKRLHPPARFQLDSERAAPDTMVLTIESGRKCFPCVWCWNRITKGPADNLEGKFRFLETWIGPSPELNEPGDR